MNVIADFLWISDGVFLHWILAISLTLLVLDVFFLDSDILTLIAMGLFAAWATLCVAPPAQWGPMVFILFLAVWAIMYYGLWKHIVRPALKNYVDKRAPIDDLAKKMPGQEGRVMVQSHDGVDSLCIRIGDEIFPIDPQERPFLQDGDTARIVKFEEGIAHVRKIAKQ